MMFGLGQALCIFYINATCRCSMGRVLDQRDNDPLGLPINYLGSRMVSAPRSLGLVSASAWSQRVPGKGSTREKRIFLIIFFPECRISKVHHAILPGA